MGLPGKRKEEEKQLLPSPLIPSDPSAYAAAVTKIAVARICLTVGYSGAESSAIRALSDIAARHLQALACSAASVAASRGRTDSNILDLVLPLEDLNSAWGFAAAADLERPLLRSSVLRELMAFVESVDEIPFPKPLRCTGKQKEARTWRSFAEAGQEPPVRHVPRWLPRFPEAEPRRIEEKGERATEEEIREKTEEKGPLAMGSGAGDLGKRRLLPAERRGVRFRLVTKNSKRMR